MIGEFVALIGITSLAVGPLAWRTFQDRREEAALRVRAEVQAIANRVLGGESFLTVSVTPAGLRHPGQVRLSAPAGWECLIEAVWPRIVRRIPEGYELVVEPRHAGVTTAARESGALRAAA